MAHSEEDEQGTEQAGMPVPFAMLVLLEATLAPISLAVGWLFGVSPLADFAWDVDAVLLGLVATVPMLGLLIVTLRWRGGPFERVREFFERDLAPSLRGCEIPDLALLSTVAGLSEELFFRGVVQAALTRWLGPVAGLGLTSALFGLLHPISLGYVVLATALGAYLGLVWMFSGNLLAPIVAHAVYDLLALVVLLEELVQRDNEGDEPR